MTVERGSNSYLIDRGLDRVRVGFGLAFTLLRRYARLMVKGDQIPLAAYNPYGEQVIQLRGARSVATRSAGKVTTT